MFITFRRIKSAIIQGASLFTDISRSTSCATHALTVAAVMSACPNEFLFDQISRDPADCIEESISDTPARDLLIAAPTQALSSTTATLAPPRRLAANGVQTYVSKLLLRWSAECERLGVQLTSGLTSHSFRREAAQTASGDCNINFPWILDRGGWATRSMSKGFNYMISSTQEGQKVARTLAEWDRKREAKLPNLRCFDRLVLSKIVAIKAQLLISCVDAGARSCYNADVLEMIIACIILRYNDI